MRIIRKNDLVVLADGSSGEALEVVVTDHNRVYKIRKTDNDEIVYFDETKVNLKKQRFRNFLADIFS